MALPVRHVSRFIAANPKDVVTFARDPRNLPAWAAGLGTGIRLEGDGVWVTDSPMGKVTVTFAPDNDLGVLDHDVTLPDGQRVHNPLRVLPNDGGAEVVFTLYRQPGTSDEAYEKDARMVAADLERLAKLLETRGR